VKSLWEEVRECFDYDDGALPEIDISRLSPSGVSAIYRMLRQRSYPVGGPPRFWNREQEEFLVDAVPDATALIVSGDAEGLYHCVVVTHNGVVLPELGIRVCPDTISLDFRGGPEWGPSEVAAFFALLRECCSLDPGAIVLPGYPDPPCPDRFVTAWSAFVRGQYTNEIASTASASFTSNAGARLSHLSGFDADSGAMSGVIFNIVKLWRRR